jgi:membrane fusion protein (multidrug efflux system)
MRNRFTLSVIALAIILGGAYFMVPKQDVTQIAPAAGDEAQQIPPGMPVEAVQVETGLIERTIEAVGTFESNQSVIIRPEIAGRISQIHFAEGTKVEKDDLLLSISDSTPRATLAQAEAALALSNANFVRAKEMFDKKIGSERNLDEARAKRDSDKAAVDLARSALNKTQLRAPFAGHLGLKKISEGDYIQPGQDIVNIEEMDVLKVDFRVPEIYLADVEAGQIIAIKVDALPGQDIKGEVYAIDPRIDTAGRSFLIRAQVKNDDAKLRPGIFARVNLVVSSDGNAMKVPEQAIIPQGDKKFVYRVIDNKAVMTEVVIGQRAKGMVQITEGLSPSDIVITSGQMKVQPDSPVMVLPNKG